MVKALDAYTNQPCYSNSGNSVVPDLCHVVPTRGSYILESCAEAEKEEERGIPLNTISTTDINNGGYYSVISIHDIKMSRYHDMMTLTPSSAASIHLFSINMLSIQDPGYNYNYLVIWYGGMAQPPSTPRQPPANPITRLRLRPSPVQPATATATANQPINPPSLQAAKTQAYKTSHTRKLAGSNIHLSAVSNGDGGVSWSGSGEGIGEWEWVNGNG
ncbi:hypothetical protein BZA77DRAFT_294430 [Pyronema omphalodes]|nr:hypothetical protein BZA77DRAFT_294430 [Pyronema omphalodes]